METIKQHNDKSTKANDTSWQDELIYQLDEMVDAFLDFPDSIPQTFRDYQFARHLLWKLCDKGRQFRRLFLSDVKPKELNQFWIRLLPYINNDMPENAKTMDPAVIRLSIGMYDILHDISVDHNSNFDRLMDQVVTLVRDIRSTK